MKTFSSVQKSYHSLIVDDEMDICFLLGNLLKRKNIEYSCASNLVSCTHILKEQPFDIIFLDNYLPDGKGIDFIPYLKEVLPNVKIVLITAYTDHITREKISEYKIDYFMPKPFQADMVNEAISTLLGNVVH